MQSDQMKSGVKAAVGRLVTRSAAGQRNGTRQPNKSLRVAALLCVGIAMALSLPLQSFEQVSIPPFIGSLPVTGDEHAYFNALVERADYFKGYSLRPISGRPKFLSNGKPDPYYGNQLGTPGTGGYRNGNSGSPLITYDVANDRHPEAQDAAKAVVPPWPASYTLKSVCLPGDDFVHLSTAPDLERGMGLYVDGELMEVASADSTHVSDGSGGLRVPVYRGRRGTTAAVHSAGAIIRRNNNSIYLSSQIRVPVGTRDGHTYLITADFYFTTPFVGRPFDYYKFYQLSSGPNDDKIWFELQTRFMVGDAYSPPAYNPTSDVGVATARYYGGFTSNPDWMAVNGDAIGSAARKALGLTKQDPILPMTSGSSTGDGGFILKPRTWTRVFWFYEQRLDDWDIMSMWMADENQEPRQIYSGLRVSVGNQGTIENLWIEMNTSQQEFTGKFTSNPGDTPIMVVYHRNMVILEDPRTVTALLVRPGPGRLPRATGEPLAPTNLRLGK